MESVYRISKTDLARKTREVFHSVQRGGTVIVESHGQPVAAILDIPEYYILRAVTRYQSQPLDVESEAGLDDEILNGLEPQDRYDQVMSFYLAGAINLGRAAELLKLPWVDLRSRLYRLGIPVRVGPGNTAELQAELKALETWEKQRKSRK